MKEEKIFETGYRQGLYDAMRVLKESLALDQDEPDYGDRDDPEHEAAGPRTVKDDEYYDDNYAEILKAIFDAETPEARVSYIKGMDEECMEHWNEHEAGSIMTRAQTYWEPAEYKHEYAVDIDATYTAYIGNGSGIQFSSWNCKDLDWDEAAKRFGMTREELVEALEEDNDVFIGVSYEILRTEWA